MQDIARLCFPLTAERNYFLTIEVKKNLIPFILKVTMIDYACGNSALCLDNFSFKQILFKTNFPLAKMYH